MTPSYRILLAGNPNVGKSTVFNGLTGLKQHTGNWSGKTVELASGSFQFQQTIFHLQDLPGTYSLISDSPEEEIARNAICAQETDLVLVVADATCLARNLNLLLQISEITPRIALCVNLMDEANRRKLSINLSLLEQSLGIPVIGISAHNRKELLRLKHFIHATVIENKCLSGSNASILYPAPIEDALQLLAKEIPENCSLPISKRAIALQLLSSGNCPKFMNPTEQSHLLQALSLAKTTLSQQGISEILLHDLLVETLIHHSGTIARNCVKEVTSQKQKFRTFDQILTSRWLGIPITLMFISLLLWITISGANIPSDLMMKFFLWFKPKLIYCFTLIRLPTWLSSLLTDGIYQTTTWVTAVMLPPMMIFFPLFTLLEDSGILPRLAFNLDSCFKKSGGCGKQALTMCMGLGCNAVGVTGCRIISDRGQRLAAMITNCFIPCNGRFSLLITLSTLFIGTVFCQEMQSPFSALFLLLLLLLGVGVTLPITALITKLFCKGKTPPFFLELPPYRRPRIIQTLVRSFLDRTFRILWRAIRVSAPTGAIIWILANITFQDNSLLTICADFLNPFGTILGMDGMILLSFLLALPANEIFLPILLMGYLSSGEMVDVSSLLALKLILVDNGWTILTAISVMFFSVLHFPCGTTLLTIKKESGSILWTFLGFLIPTATAILVCMVTTGCWYLLHFFL